MPKFSAYMRGEKGIQGEIGQPSLLDGVVNGYDNLPNKINLTEDRNYVYYVKENDGIHLYVYEGGSGKNWQHLGVVTAGFSTTQYASVSTKDWYIGVQPDVLITTHDNQQTTGLKSFDFHFDIPEGQPAGFSTTQFTSVSTIKWNEIPTVNITPNEETPNYEKSFTFDFNIPEGRPAGFADEMEVSVTTLSSFSNKNISGDIVEIEKTEYNKAKIKNIKIDIEPIQDLIIPSEYQVLEYIESYGNNYINTEFIPSADDGFEIDFSSTNDINENNYGCILGGRSSSTIKDYQLTTYKSATAVDRKGTLRWGNGSGIDAHLLESGIRGKAKLYQKTYTAPDGTVTSLSETESGEYPLFVFALNNANNATQQGSGTVRIYSLKLYRGSTIAKDFIPVKDSDNKYGLYDIIGKKFHSAVSINSGTQISGGANASWPTPEHPCPISGWTSAKVTRTGKNLYNPANAQDNKWLNNTTGAIESATGYWFSGYISVKAGQTYCKSVETGSVRSAFYDANKNFISYLALQNGSFTVPSGAFFFAFCGATSTVAYNGQVQLELGSIATPYVPYSGEQVTIDLDGMRYGGIVDITNGTMTVDSEMFSHPLSDFTPSTQYTTVQRFYRGSAFVNTIQGKDGLCNIATFSYNTADSPHFYIDNNQVNVFIPSDTDPSTEIQVLAKLADPITVTLTPAQLALLQGDNIIWADSGDIDIDYSTTNDAYVNVTPDETTPDYAKKFNFEFGIPNGVPGGFGNISVSTVQLEPTVPAEVSVTTSGPESAKNFDFLFKIPKGIKGDQGDALGTYLGVEFTSTQFDSSQDVYWINNTLHINRGANKKIPIYILNNENNNIAATFKINENEILHEADLKFDGILYLVAPSNIPRFQVNSYTTTSYEEEPSVEAYYPNQNDPSIIYLDFKLPKIDIPDLGNMAYINDAPHDGNIYARRNGTWVAINL